MPGRLLINALGCLTLAALVLLWLSQYSNLDLILADHYFDNASGTFPWRYQWFADLFMHIWVKHVLVALGVATLLVVIVDGFHPLRRLNHFSRPRLRFVAIVSVVVPLFVNRLKASSLLHCPWVIERYGGYSPYLRLLDHLPQGVHAGHCFPAGHAMTGLWLAAFAVFWLPHKPKTAWAVFFTGMMLGFALGWVQQMRGAHFLSHTLWAIWWACLLMLALLGMFYYQLFEQPAKSG